MSKHAYASQDRNSENTRRRIQQWIMDMGYSIRQDNPAGTLWVLFAELPNNIGFAVVQEPGKTDRVVVQVGIDLAPEHQRLLSALSEQERKDFIWELKFALLPTAIEFTMNEPLERIGIGKPIYLDGMNKDVFAHRVQQVRCAALLVLWKFLQRGEKSGQEFVAATVN